MAGFGLGGGGEDWFGQLRSFLQPGGKRDAANGLLRLIFFPATAGKVTAHDAFDGERFRFFDDHAAPFQLRGEWLKLRREGIVWTGQEMVRLPRGHLREPEMRDLRQDFALTRYAIGQDAVEGGNAVGGDKQEAVAQIENLPDFAAFEFADAGQIQREQWFVQHRANMRRGRGSAKSNCGFQLALWVRHGMMLR